MIEIKARPITFSPEMVQALLDGRKTQTRRSVKPQLNSPFLGLVHRPLRASTHEPVLRAWFGAGPSDSTSTEITCPYGTPGDLLYIADRPNSRWDSRFRQAMHMPRWASRITLRITDVRVERVREISIEDTIAEGIDIEDEHADNFSDGERRIAAGGSIGCCAEIWPFRLLWDSINEARGFGWEANPWVWVICFEVIRANVDDVLAGRVAA